MRIPSMQFQKTVGCITVENIENWNNRRMVLSVKCDQLHTGLAFTRTQHCFLRIFFPTPTRKRKRKFKDYLSKKK